METTQPEQAQAEITVLIPVYNKARYLPAALDALLRQTFSGWVCHLLDDGSQDDSLKMAQAYASRDGRFRVKHQENQGVTRTLNRLLSEEITTPYVMILDADDLIHPELFARSLALFRTEGVDMVEVFNDRVPETFTNDEIPALTHEPEVQILRDLSCFQTRSTAVGQWINKCNKLYRYEPVKALRFDPQLTYEEDFWFNVLAHAACRSKACIRACLYYYRTADGSLTQRVNFPRYVASGIRRIVLSHTFFLEEGRLLPEYREAYERDITRDAFRMILQKNLKKNWALKESRALFLQAADALAKFVKQQAIFPKWLTRRQRLALKACIARHFWCCRLMVLIASI